MEWFVLLVLVPAIVVPVVLLFGLAGCGFSVPSSGPGPPTVVSAVPLDGNRVRLAWTDPHEIAVKFEIERTANVNPPSPLSMLVEPPPGAEEPYEFVDFVPEGAGTEVDYRIRSIVVGTGAESRWSPPATVETWFRAFSSGLEQNGVNESVPGACIVQRLSPGTLGQDGNVRGGNLFGITVTAATDADLHLSRVTISRPSLAGDDFDSAAVPVDIFPPPGTAPPAVVTAGQRLPLPQVEFPVDIDEALLIAFDVSDPGNARVHGGVAHTAYVKRPPPGGTIAEAGAQDRAGFTEQPDELWFIDAIDLATKWPPIP